MCVRKGKELPFFIYGTNEKSNPLNFENHAK